MKALQLSALSFVLVAAVASAQAPDVVVKEVTGEAAIVNGDKVRAAADAKKAALRDAVEQVAGTMITAATLTQNSQLVNDRVFSHSEGYVRKHEVLSTKEEAGVIKVTVRAEIGTKDLDKDLQAIQGLIGRLANRKIVIVLQEQTIQPPSSDKGGQDIITNSSVMTTVLTEAFKKDGWTIIDPSYAEGKLNLEQAVGAGRVKTGDLSKADYFLYGKVSIRNLSPEGVFGVGAKGQQGIFSVQGEYDLGVFAADSGLQLARLSDNVKSSAKDISLLSYEKTAFNLVRARGPEVIGKIRGAVVEHLRNAETNGNLVSVSVLGLADYKAVQDFKVTLASGVNNVRDVRGGSFSSGKAQFDIVYLGTTEDLAASLGDKNFKKRAVSITGVTGNTIEVTIK